MSNTMDTQQVAQAIKEARTIYPVGPLIRKRWSARAFSDELLSVTDLMTLFEAASWAPSAMNEQPWQYRYALRGTPSFHALWELLLPGNRPWTVNAAALIAISGSKLHRANGAANVSWQHDVGMANANLLLQATSMNIHGHLIGGFDKERATALLGIDSRAEELVCLLALGRTTDPSTLDEPFRTREITPRTRFNVTEIAQELT